MIIGATVLVAFLLLIFIGCVTIMAMDKLEELCIYIDID